MCIDTTPKIDVPSTKTGNPDLKSDLRGVFDPESALVNSRTDAVPDRKLMELFCIQGK